MNELIKELREWWADTPCRTLMENELPNISRWEKRFEEILSRHAEPKEEWTKSIDAETGAPCHKLLPTPDKAVEPLAVLADRKGWEIHAIARLEHCWHIEIYERKKLTDGQIILGGSYAAAEAKARKYLEALPDVKGGKI